MEKTKLLLTEEGENISDFPWNVYPRPQLKRHSFLSLNGYWDFAFSTDSSNINYNKKILVPFPPQSPLSGVFENIDEKFTLWYRKTFTIEQGFNKGKLILHFGAVDQKAKIYIGDKFVGEHIGGYGHFSFDISDFVCEGVNTLTVSVNDNLSDYKLPYGKQRNQRGGMWYTPISGIWQSVWIESVGTQYIKSLKIDTTLNCAKIKIDGIESGKIILKEINKKIEFSYGEAVIEIDNPINWTPENPFLYHFTVKGQTDSVESYFALRTLEIREINGIKRLLLNGKPYFFHGILDQGYFSDGIFIPANENGYEKDITAMKSLGFNMIRKHIKVEPEQFYYDCDRLGMVVFQDMVNNGKYSFFKDTVLPTLGFIKKKDINLHKDAETRNNFIKGMEETVTSLYNHPCICCYTIFNEGWGQFCSDEMYEKLSSLDSSRFIDSASGWFINKKNDFDSRHIYFKKVKLEYKNKPLFLSEFGGFAYGVKNHLFNEEKSYGYKTFKNREEYVKALIGLYKNEIIPLVKKGLCATVYTQLSDVEDEINGILTYDRKVMKIKTEEFLPISKELINAIDKNN